VQSTVKVDRCLCGNCIVPYCCSSSKTRVRIRALNISSWCQATNHRPAAGHGCSSSTTLTSSTRSQSNHPAAHDTMADQKYITALQPFVLAAKTAEGDAAAELVLQATQAPGCFVFSELLECESIQALGATHPQHLELLKIFAYGSLADYRCNQLLMIYFVTC
jgi:hypothetical protein